MALTQEQTNVDLLAKTVAADIKLRYPSMADSTAVIAYNGLLTRLPTANGLSYIYVAGSTLTPVGRFILAATGKGSGRWILDATHCNVLDFGADNMAAVDSAGAFNSAIDYARTLSGTNGGTFRFFIKIPPGWYLLNAQLNLTNCNGIWLVGEGGSYINTGFIGCTSNADGSGPGIIADFTGSSLSGARNISFTANSIWGQKASKIGVQFALSQDGSGNQLGGLNCRLENCYIELYDSTTVNGGFGTIGLLDVRSEECSIKDCLIKANVPMLFSSQFNISVDGSSNNFSSSFANIATSANGSMGVATCSGTSLQTIQKRKPALILINTDTFTFIGGYIGRISSSSGNEETAIRFVGQNDNPFIMATIESYSRVVRFGTQCVNPFLRIVTANQTAPLTDAFDFTGSEVISPKIDMSFRLTNEFNNGRTLLYHADVNGGDSPATGSIISGLINCSKWVDNSKFVSANLFRNSQNTAYNSGQPFTKTNGAAVDQKAYNIPFGNTQSGHPDLGANLLRFTKADKTTKTSGNGGTYRIRVYGSINAGSYSSQGIVSVDFRSTMVLTQKADGTLNSPAIKTEILNKCASNTAYLDITNIVMLLDLGGTYGQVFCIVVNNGTSTGEPIVFNGVVEVASDFAVNQSLVFN